MLLLRKVRRAIVEGIDIDVHILLACYERTQLYVSIQMSRRYPKIVNSFKIFDCT